MYLYGIIVIRRLTMKKKEYEKLLAKAIKYNAEVKKRQEAKALKPKKKKVKKTKEVKKPTTSIDITKKYSRPEKIMATILVHNNIPFTFQKRLEGSMRRFDFYIEEGILSDSPVAIEVNGEQHYNKGRGKRSSEMYLASIESDSFKREYCTENNIELIFVDARRSSYIHIIKSIEDIPSIAHLVKGTTNKKLSKLKKEYFKEVD